MAAPNHSFESSFRLADRLAAARRGRFVGREAELLLLRSALLAAEPPFAVLYVYGPGGIGKTTLLREYVRLAAELGRPVFWLDGRNISPSPPDFLLAVRRALGLNEGESTPIAFPSQSLLFIDTYEALAPLDAWLRETFLPQLPGHSLVIMAGRHAPQPAWRTDMDWAELTQLLPLRNLRPEESQTYLTTRGILDNQHPKLLALTHGHPLALSLVADILSQSKPDTDFTFQTEPDVLRLLLGRFVQDVPSAEHRLALQLCTLLWATTEELLAHELGEEHAGPCFEWLRQLSFIEQGPLGLFPHDLARDVLDADFRWRNPTAYQQLNQQLTRHLHQKLLQVNEPEQQRIWLDLLYLARNNPFIKPYFDWNQMHTAYTESPLAHDTAAILEMVQAHEGEASAQIAQYWLQRQPQAFKIYRSVDGQLVGFMANLVLHLATPEDIAIDPAIPAALAYAQRHGPVRPGEEIAYLRFWMGRDTYQAPSPALNLTAITNTIYWTTHPKLAWNFIATRNPDFLQPHFTSINIRRSAEADFEVGGQSFGVFSHDWRAEPVSAWLAIKAERYPRSDLTLEQMEASASSPPPLLVLSQPEFEDAVRQALRDYTRLDLLAANPLLRSRLVSETAEPAALQTCLLEAAATLTGNPKDEKLYRAIYHTYLEPTATQEQAAELLDLPFNTYRYHLAQGLKRLVELLWQRELRDPPPPPTSTETSR